MMLTTHATARLPFGAPAGLLHDPVVLESEFAVRIAAGLSCKRNGRGMVASENNAEGSIQGLARTRR